MMILRRSYWSLVKAEYELVFDLKIAKTLGLKIPQSTLKQTANKPFAVR
jgi:hypothetical protein